jgi:hypothetical protein
VLKGEWSAPTIVGYAFWSERRFALSEEYVFCAKWQDTKIGRVLWIGELSGLYEKKSARWVQCERFPVAGAEPESLTYEQVQSRVREASLESVVDSSDVVVRGTIDSVWTSRYPASRGRFGVLEHRRLRATTWLKGNSPSAHVDFVIPVVNTSYVPRWFRVVPGGIRRGTEWIVFLKQGARGLYPFGGPNSLLQVRGDEVIYDEKASYSLGVNETMRKVRSEVSHARDQ